MSYFKHISVTSSASPHTDYVHPSDLFGEQWKWLTENEQNDLIEYSRYPHATIMYLGMKHRHMDRANKRQSFASFYDRFCYVINDDPILDEEDKQRTNTIIRDCESLIKDIPDLVIMKEKIESSLLFIDILDKLMTDIDDYGHIAFVHALYTLNQHQFNLIPPLEHKKDIIISHANGVINDLRPWNITLFFQSVM